MEDRRRDTAVLSRRTTARRTSQQLDTRSIRFSAIGQVISPLTSETTWLGGLIVPLDFLVVAEGLSLAQDQVNATECINVEDF